MLLSAAAFPALAGAILLMFRRVVRHISAAEQKFWAIVEHAPVGVALVDGAGRLTHVNDTLCSTPGP